MASYPHGHPNPTASCCRPNTCCFHPPPPPPHHPPPPPQQTHIYPCYQNPSSQLDLYHLLELEGKGFPPPLPPIHHSHQQFIHLRRNPTPEEPYPSVSSLVSRIAALESSLLRHRLSSAPVWSLRDIAARTIQMHFRAFLARRSRTLGQLKQLASIKSALHSLRASTSGNAQIDPQSIFRKTKVLHQKLEFIQGGDPMIRDGKRSIYRELIRFKDLIDKIYFKRAVRYNQHRGNNSRVFSRVDAGDLSEDENELRGRPSGIANKSNRFMGNEEDNDGFDIGVLPVKGGSSHRKSGGLLKRAGGGEGRVKKTVTFADDGKLYRATIATPERNSSGEEEEEEEEEEGDEIELLDNLGRKVEEIGGSEDEDEDGAEGDEEEDFVFSAPLPVKMDRRAAADLMKKMKRDAGNENR